MKMAITLGWNGEVLAERSSDSRGRLLWWIMRLAPLYASGDVKAMRHWRYGRNGRRLIVDFGDRRVFAWMEGV